MIVRSFVASLLAAGLLAVAVPAPSFAEVADTPSTSFPGFNDTVFAIAHRGKVIYVGGEFTQVTDSNGTHTRKGAAAVSAQTGLVLPWNPAVQGTVLRIVAAKEGVYLGGQFKKVKGVKHKNIAMVTGTGKAKLIKKFRHSANLPVRAISLAKGQVIIGGEFTKFDRKDRNRLAAVGRKAPFKLRAWAPQAQLGGVRDLVTARKNVYVAGEFRKFNDQQAFQRLALVSLKNGKTVKAFDPKIRDIVLDIAVSGGRVYAGLGGPRGGQVWAVDGANGSTAWARRLDGDVQAVTVMSGTVYVGGHFNQVCVGDDTDQVGVCATTDATRRRGASFDAAGQVGAWDPEGNSATGVFALDPQPGSTRLAVGGAFTAMNAGTVPVLRFAVFDSVI
jgi:hypothetical protein